MIASLLRDRAAELERGGRSPLYVALMRGAADDADAGGIVASLFEDRPGPPQAVPELRLLAALHHLVLSGRAPQLARHFPTAGGDAPPSGAWAVAARTLAEHEQEIRARLRRPLQTNEPGRCAALYGGLLWLSERHRLPVRLLEIGASAGLNLNVERLRYLVGGHALGDPASPLTLDEPWVGSPVGDPPAAAARLRIVERAGCDRAPVDPATPEGRLELASFVWPDEPDRQAGLALAAEIAARHPVVVEQRSAAAWLAERLADAAPERLTVIWQSAFAQYLDEDERAALRSVFASAPAGPLAWLTLEPPASPRVDGSFEVSCRERPEGNGSGDALLLAHAGYHGPPVVWAVSDA